MDRNDSQAIEQLFGKIAAVERQAPPRDAEAEAYIRDKIASQPGAPYYMAQTIVVQEQALQAAQARIDELESQAAEAPRQSGGLFGGLFGDSRTPQRSGVVPRVGRPGGPSGGQPYPTALQPRGGGGFLAGAAQTAMGVAGGVLLANAIGGMFGGSGEAQAAEPQPEAEDAGFDDGGFGDTEL